MVALLFSHFRVTNVKLINEKICFNITVSKWHGLRDLLRYFVFSLFCCKYIYVIFEYAGLQQQYLFARLQKTFSSCEPKEEWPHSGLYNYNGRQIGLFKWNGLILDRLTGPRLMSLWNAWG